MSVRIINADEARALLSYETETGVFRWRESRGRVAARHIAGAKASNGYWDIYVCGRRYRGHRLAWLIVTGDWPPETIDHINGDRADNRIDNLRQATLSENHANKAAYRNNSSGAKGVHFCNRDQRWIAKIMRNGVTHHIGQFVNKADAANAHAAAAKQLFGEFARVQTA